jgi:hypothetical protein
MNWWRIARCMWDDTRALNDYLKDGWEPFAVSDIELIWLRRPSDREHAGAGEPGPRLEGEVARLARRDPQ